MAEQNFTWPAMPQSEEEFERLIQAMDKLLSERGVKPFQRSFHVPRLLWEAFGWSANIVPPKSRADEPGYAGEVLIAKVHRWYEVTYGNQALSPGVYGHFPVRLANTVWKVRAPVIFGQVMFFVNPNLENRGRPSGTRVAPATGNLLCQVVGLPQGLASKLSPEELHDFGTFAVSCIEALRWRSSALKAKPFDVARADYEASTEDLVSGRYGQARWGAQQATEKTFKGILSAAGKSYPTSGPNGHNLKHLAGLMKVAFGVEFEEAVLQAAGCSAGVRYGEEPSDLETALLANHAVLKVFRTLADSESIAALLKGLGIEGA